MWALVLWYKGTNVSEDLTVSIFRKNMQAKGSSETLVIFYPTTSRNIPENFQIVITSQITKTNSRKRELCYVYKLPAWVRVTFSLLLKVTRKISMPHTISLASFPAIF
jgi:hypothetical protein